ncbi:ATP-binding cassette domain-containing protein [Rhizobium etli]|uniref:ATP-binding cassette domain-containing protein n=1 Tax=Rhizobium etli TaxID=29449 RepID=UPI00041935E7
MTSTIHQLKSGFDDGEASEAPDNVVGTKPTSYRELPGQKQAPMNSDKIIEATNVSKWYGAFRALTDVNLTVRKGERIVICGPSGSGKSTLIRCFNRP